MTMPTKFTVKVVGVTFVPGYPLNLHALASVASSTSGTALTEPLTAILRRNPDNPYDANAIEVHVPALGDHAMIGHLPAKNVAARLAPLLDAGETWRASITSVLIDPAHEDRPGISVEVTKVPAPQAAAAPASSLL